MARAALLHHYRRQPTVESHMTSGDQASSEAAHKQGAVVLVVEDEWIVRMAVADHLRSCGYRVLEAANADEARAMLEANDQVAIVFSDVQMPGSVDGFGLARWVRQHKPGIRVILTSGVVRAHEVARDLCEEGAFMEKPYDHDDLDRRIRKALGR
jgi:CheY-like chemotaxis protein